MGILDEAIREHLELKRQHGAADPELKQLEDEAFGQAERPGAEEPVPDLLAEAPTEFMAQPETAEGPAPRRESPSIADLQEAPPPAPPEEPVPPEQEAPSEEPAPVDEAPAGEEQPAMEHEIVAEPPEAAEPEVEPEPAPEPAPEPEPAGPTTEERQAIAEQPTELHDMEEELTGTEDLEAEVSVEGPAPADDDEYEDEDDAFWNEQRLSDELDQALEAPREPEPELADEAEPELAEEPEAEAEYAEEPEPDEPEAPRRAEDPLEETPDFLEETPEDDQLWFEQKPPKDFDFDD
jgi:hypothetical protein